MQQCKPGNAPKASPFKQPVTAAAPKPAEAPKSAFGATKPADAPKESPFKSAFAGSKPFEAPRASPFKSAFGTAKPSTESDAAPKPAEVPAKASPFKSTFGTGKPSTEDKQPAAAAPNLAEAPKASPFKSAFGSAKPAEGASSSGSSKAQPTFSWGARAVAPSEFVSPSLPSSDAELPPFFVGVPPAAPLTTSAAVLPAPVASTPTVGPHYGWKCDMCKKLKSLSGSHLEGKTEVRSECWPCAKKTLFRRVELAEGEDAGAPAQGSTQTNSAAAAAAAVTPPKERTVKPAEATKSEIVGPKPGDAPKDGPFKSAFGTAKPPTEEKQPVTAAAPKPAEAPKSAFGATKPADRQARRCAEGKPVQERVRHSEAVNRGEATHCSSEAY